MNIAEYTSFQKGDLTLFGELSSHFLNIIELVTQSSPEALNKINEFCELASKQKSITAEAHGKLLLSLIRLQSSDLHLALKSSIESLNLFLSIESPLWQSVSESLVGKIYFNLGLLEESERHLTKSITRVKDLSDVDNKYIHATSLNHLGGVLFRRGDMSQSLICLERALEIWSDIKNTNGQINSLINIGSMQTVLGQFDGSIVSLNSAYKIYSEHSKNPLTGGLILSSLARSHYKNDDNMLAIEVSLDALILARESHDTPLTGDVLLNLGTYYLDSGFFTKAEEYLSEATSIYNISKNRSGEMSSLDSLGMLRHKQGDIKGAQALYRASLKLANELSEPQGELDSRLHLAEVELALGNLAEADVQVSRSLQLAVESESPKEEAEAHRLLAELAQRQGDYRRAFEHSQEHMRVKDALFNTERDRQTRNLSIQFEVERARYDANVYRVRTEVEQEARLAAEQLVQERTADLARAHHEVVTRLAMAAEYRDDTTGEHTRRVGRTSARIARALGWSENQARILGVAARLHDVGKIGIPDSILLKSGKLTEAEFEQMKTHTLIGSRILSGGRSELLQMAEEIALTHHERWDGSGYPHGLSGENVPLTGRIVALADVFDALTQDRPYKRAWTTGEALAELQALAGSHFDPMIVQTALTVLTPVEDGAEGAALGLDDGMLDGEDATHILSVFEQLLIERTRDVEEARLASEQAARELRRVARTDGLTGLPARLAFEADLGEAVQGRGQAADGLAVVSIELRGLREINARLGRTRGDQVLQQFSRGLERHLGGLGQPYRVDGAGFALITEGIPEDGAVAGMVRTVLQEVEMEGECGVTAGLVISGLTEPDGTAEDFLRRIDRHLDRGGTRLSPEQCWAVSTAH